MSTRNTTMRTFLTAAAIAIAVSVTPVATAQFGSRSFMSQAFEPYVMQRDLPLMVTTLELEEWQRPIVDALVDDYLASFNAGIENVRLKMQDAGMSGDKADLSAMLRPLANWNRERLELYGKLSEMIKSQLSPQQIERWPAWERAIRRERLLPLSELSGEGVNLVGVVTDLAPPPEVRSAAAPVIDAYEIRLDAALSQRQARDEEALPAMMDAMAAMDHGRAADLQDRIMAARVQIRDAQEQSIVEIAGAMGDEWGPKFKSLAMQRAFPEVFSPNPIMRLFEGALALNELTSEQRSSITSLKDEFQREWDLLSAEMLSTIKREEPQGPRRRAAGAAAGAAATPEQRQGRSGDLEAMRRKRHDLGERYRQLLEKQLSKEQFTSLPGAAKYASEGLGAKFGGGPTGESATQDMRAPNPRRGVPGSDKPGSAPPGMGADGPTDGQGGQGGQGGAAPAPNAVE